MKPVDVVWIVCLVCLALAGGMTAAYDTGKRDASRELQPAIDVQRAAVAHAEESVAGARVEIQKANELVTKQDALIQRCSTELSWRIAIKGIHP